MENEVKVPIRWLQKLVAEANWATKIQGDWITTQTKGLNQNDTVLVGAVASLIGFAQSAEGFIPANAKKDVS